MSRAPAVERASGLSVPGRRARRDGAGDPNLAASYLCGEPLTTEPTPDRIGADPYRPYCSLAPRISTARCVAAQGCSNG